VQAVKDGAKFALFLFSPANIKHQIAVMQTKSVPELIVGFFKMIFYAFYYSGFGVSVVIKYFLNVLMTLMRGPAPEEEPAPPEGSF
jgi:ryanodine receptor 2